MINKLKKTKRIVCILSLFLLTVFSCSKEFLDEPQNTSGVVDQIVFSSRATVEAYIAGIFATYKTQWNPTLYAGYEGSDVDTGGLYAMYFARSIKGNDLIQSANWFQFDYAHGNREPTYRRVNFTWQFNYQLINSANILIGGVTRSENLSQEEKAEFIALAKTIRAFHYFQLALEFAPNYNNNRQLARFPIYTEQADGSPGKAPAPLSEVFDLIITDLEEAIPLIPETRIGKSYINRAVASGILARVLSVTQDNWQECSNLARYAYGNNAASAVVSSNWGSGFIELSDQEWIWGFYQDGTNETNYYWMSPYVMTDHLTLSYQATYVNPNFVDQFSNTDVRKLFFDIYNVSATVPWREYITTKFSFTFSSDVPTMRKSEMVLLDAEAQYHLGNESMAKQLLFTLQSERDPNAVMSNNSGQALLDEILFERRKELYGELGVEWFDAKRYNLPIVRDPEHRVQLTVPSDSELFFLKIPQLEIDANPNIDGSINN